MLRETRSIYSRICANLFMHYSLKFDHAFVGFALHSFYFI